ncbi:MAG TPA: ferrous iron transport protein B [Terriglobia bacterium]|nr:ferrous iron transport protein B [Terriglobia bacterium]
MKIALVGQPNCGKSTIFNSVAGYRAATGNFPGTTVRLAWSRVRLNGMLADLVDLPGIYSLTPTNPAETAGRKFLLHEDVSLIINVVDASLLSRSLELTLDLRELGIPMVVCLNMMDEAERRGIKISSQKLSEFLALPVVETIGSRGVGVKQLFREAQRQVHQPPRPASLVAWNHDIERSIRRMQDFLDADSSAQRLPSRFLAIKLLENDEEITREAGIAARNEASRLREQIEQTHGRPAESVIMSERHDCAMRLFNNSATLTRPRPDPRAALDNLLTHRKWGYIFLAAILVGFFWAVFGIGSLIERAIAGKLGLLTALLLFHIPKGSLEYSVVASLMDGVRGGAGIILPYLVPFLFGLAFLEDVGYLPRVAYLLDGLLHRIGLHGTSMLPIILGYGCSVPACLATRILPSRRDRFLASVLATLVPCSARSTVIFALVAYYLGPMWALGIFCFNALVVILSGLLLARIWPEISAGMILEVPRYQWPALRVLAGKVWLRLREFVVLSWPLLIAGSLALGLGARWNFDHYANAALRPLTLVLGLPSSLGTTLVFGVLRKELALVMLALALGTTSVANVLSATQIVVFTVFITFYIPCVATLVALVREIGRKMTALAAAYTFVLATLMGVAARLILPIFLGS